MPYAERYHEPGDPLHGQPLYLDCCALVRRALQDMQKDFGFRIGRWNQAVREREREHEPPPPLSRRDPRSGRATLSSEPPPRRAAQYQFDTLPLKREFEQLEPGDLVFVEGTYHTGRHRQQVGDLR